MPEFTRVGSGCNDTGEPVGYNVTHAGCVDGIRWEGHMYESHGELARDYGHCRVWHPVAVLVVGRGRAHLR